MKKILLASLVLILTSCFGGWSDEDVQVFKNGAPRGMSENMIDCFLDAAQNKYSSYEEFEIAINGDDDTVGEWLDKLYQDCGGGEPGDPDVVD
jgi:hypothetical protein